VLLVVPIAHQVAIQYIHLLATEHLGQIVQFIQLIKEKKEWQFFV
jgi:hypothetical protein